MSQVEVSFTVTDIDADLIEGIVNRGLDMAKKVGRKDIKRQDAEMDITAAHANGCALDLGKFIDFDEFNFAHDFFGIARHLDRTTGKLGGCFRPRCAA